MNIHDFYSLIFKIWRKKRFDKFLTTIEPDREQVMLDVGGYPKNWVQRNHFFKNITCLNLEKVDCEEGQNIETVAGDGTNLQYEDKQFDIVFSNSVIEHVGDFAAQERFSNEVRRVGKKLWIQTPSYEFPIEPHFLFPFFHWLPKKIRQKIVYITPWYIISKPDKEEVNFMIDTTRLLKRKELKKLFPDCELYTEKFLFMPKSYVMYRRGYTSAETPDHPNEEEKSLGI